MEQVCIMYINFSDFDFGSRVTELMFSDFDSSCLCYVYQSYYTVALGIPLSGFFSL